MLKKLIVGAAAGKDGGRVSTGALMYLAPWVVWPLMIPPALIFWGFASAGTASAVIIGVALCLGLALLTGHAWSSFAARDNVREQTLAALTTGGAGIWLIAATAFGLFHKPDVDIWPEFWRLPEFALKSFTLPLWGTWFTAMFFGSLAWNITRVGKPAKEDKGERESKTPDTLGQILDGSVIHVDSTIPDDEGKPKVIKATVKGVPGKHTGAGLAGSIPEPIESLKGLRPGAVRAVPSQTKASEMHMTITVQDPHAKSQPWPGPSAPETSIAESPVPFGPHTDGEIAAIWLCGDEDSGRALQHVACAGMNGSGKSQGGKLIWADALTRTDVELWGADISGKIWQTFGPLMPYISKIAGLNGTDDEGKAKNLKDASAFLKELEKEATERQQLWGKDGINQWGVECFERYDHKLRIAVIEEAADLLEREGDYVVKLSRKLRSAGILLWITAQRFSWDQVPTSLRSQLAAVLCYGMMNTADASLILPEDVEEVLARGGVMNSPGGWQNNTPGKVIAAVAGMPYERRSDPVRTYWATNEALAAALAEHGTRLWSEEEIEGMKTGTYPEGILVRTRTEKQRVQNESRTRTGARVHEDSVRDARTYEDDDVHVQDDGMYANTDEGVYMDAELEEMAYVDPNLPMDTSAFGTGDLRTEGIGAGPEKLPIEEFRRVVQQHLTSLLARGLEHCEPSDINSMEPPTGRSRVEVRNELLRLAEKAEDWEVSVIPPFADGGSGQTGVYKLVAPQVMPGELVSAE